MKNRIPKLKQTIPANNKLKLVISPVFGNCFSTTFTGCLSVLFLLLTSVPSLSFPGLCSLLTSVLSLSFGGVGATGLSSLGSAVTYTVTSFVTSDPVTLRVTTYLPGVWKSTTSAKLLVMVSVAGVTLAWISARKAASVFVVPSL